MVLKNTVKSTFIVVSGVQEEPDGGNTGITSVLKYTNMKIHKISRYKMRDYYRRGSGVHLYTNTLQGRILLTNIKVLNTYSYQTYRIIKYIYMY